jgi:hypothetical protein
VVDTLSGAGNAADLGVVSSPFNALVDQGSAPLIAAIAGGGNWTVVSGANSSLAMMNAVLASQPTQVYFGGGFNSFSQAPYASFAAERAIVNVDSSGGPRNQNVMTGGAMIVAPYGQTTVNMFPNSIIDVVSLGSSASVVVNTMTAPGGAQNYQAVQVDGGASSSVVTVNGAAGINLTYIATSGFGFVNPNGAEVTVNGGTGVGSVTIAAGTSSLYAVNTSGLLYGGSAGGNSLQTSTISGAATLFGGGNNDFLQLDGDHQVGSTGDGTNVLLAGQNASGSDTLYAGAGTGTLQGGLAGNNTINFGSGTYTVFGMHNGGITASNGNTFVDSVGGGHYTIEDFYSQQFGGAGFDKVTLGTATLSSLGTVAGSGGFTSSVATLSDGTQITFQNVSAIQLHGTYLS